jgi:hypothetical protein
MRTSSSVARSRRVLVQGLVLVLVTLTLPARGQETPGVVDPGTHLVQLPPALRAAAEGGLRTFKQLVNQSNYQRLGFETAGEVQAATLGEPLFDVYVRLDALRAYTPGGDTRGLLVRGPRVLFPVEVASAVRSSLTVVRLPGGDFKAVSFGARSFARSFSAAREAAAQARGVPADAFSIVRVPALNAQFLGLPAAGGLSLVVVTDDARFDLRAGSTLSAAEVLGRMVQRARSLRDDAPG